MSHNLLRYKVYFYTDLAARAQIPMINRTLKIAEPTIVPVPISESAIRTPIMEVNNSGAEVPAFLVRVNHFNSFDRLNSNFYSHKCSTSHIFFQIEILHMKKN